MKGGKLVALAVLGLLAWQQQEALGSHLGKVGRVGPTVRAFMEMRSYRPGLIIYIRDNGGPPRDLAGWIDQRYPPKGGREASRDVFGNRYRAERDREMGWVLRSCGPDGFCRNEDDLLVPLSASG